MDRPYDPANVMELPEKMGNAAVFFDWRNTRYHAKLFGEWVETKTLEEMERAAETPPITKRVIVANKNTPHRAPERLEVKRTSTGKWLRTSGTGTLADQAFEDDEVVFQMMSDAHTRYKEAYEAFQRVTEGAPGLIGPVGSLGKGAASNTDLRKEAQTKQVEVKPEGLDQPMGVGKD